MKKEWKKVLSLVLALAMVLTACPFVFAEGEEAEEVTPVQTTYDFAEFFETTNEWSGVAETDYPNASLTLKGGSQWKAGFYWRGAPALTEISGSNHVTRAGAASRAYSNTKNDTLTVESGTGSPKRVPNMTASHGAPAYVKKSSTETEWHYDGVSRVYGDGGYYASSFTGYGGSIGYGFSEGVGYNNSGIMPDVHPAVHFVAPRSGIINPEFRAYAKGNEELTFRMYKRVTPTQWQPIYPASIEGSVTIEGDYSELDPSTQSRNYVLDEHETEGWNLVSSVGATERKDGLVYVEAGDEIVLRFGKQNFSTPSIAFALDTLKMHYVSKWEFSYFADTRMVDMGIVIPEGATISVAENSGLIATDVEGVFTVAQTFVDGTVVPVTITVGTSTAIIDAKITAVPTYDAAEAFATTNDYDEGKTEAEKYADKSQTSVITNDGSDMWAVGYFEKNNINEFYRYTVLQRPKDYRAYEDTLYTSRAAAMTWTISGAYFGSNAAGETVSGYTNDDDGGWSLLNTNATQGSLSYNFGSDTYIGNSAAGHNSYAGNTVTPTIIFTAPLDGVINPFLKAAATKANSVMYRMYKVDGAGKYTQIYPLESEKENWVQPTCDWDGNYALSDVAYNNWAYLPASSNNSWMIQNKGAVRVNKGDKIYLRFAGVTGSEAFALSQLTMNYLGRFDENDELLLEAPFANYEETYDLVTPRDKEVNLSREPLNNPEAKGTMEYTITGNTEVLRTTNDAGVYELTGKINAGGEAAVVTAAYYSKGKSSANHDKPLYTTSTNVYVKAASMTVDTFSYDLFKSHRLGYDNDGFLLPYYTNATERAMYGEIDLGLADEWKNSTVTFTLKDNEGKEVETEKVEYLGNGRIRVVGKHDFTDAGGAWPNKSGKDQKPDTVADSYNGHLAIRDITTAGANPVVMTIKAPDGGVRKFNIWTFDAKVHGDTVSKIYGFDYANYYVPNAVTRFEGFVDMTATNGGSFVPMYRDNGKKSHISPVSDDMYLQAESTSWWFPKVPSFSTAGELMMFSFNETNWEDYTPAEYVDFDGASWTFEAPKSGVVNVKNFMTDKLHANNNYHFVSNAVVYVRHYKANGTYTELIKRTYGTNYGNSTSGIFSDETETTGTMAKSLEEDGTMNITVDKGDIIRVILANNTDTTAVSTLVKKNSKNAEDTALYLPDPTFTYVNVVLDRIDTDNNMIVVTPSSYDGLANTGVLAILYGEAGNIIETVTDSGEDETIFVDSEAGGVGINYQATDFSYAKVFFWESLDNIKPLAGDILLRK